MPMKIHIMAAILLIFAIFFGIMTIEGGEVKYTFDKEAALEKHAADSAALAKEMELAKEKELAEELETRTVSENPYIKITTTAKAYDKIDKLKAELGKTLLVVDVILEVHGYNNLKIRPSDFSVKINNSSIYQHPADRYDLKPIRKQYLTNVILPKGPDPVSRVGGFYLQDGNIRKGSLLFDDVPLDIESYEFMWALADEYNTTIDGVHFGNDSTT